MRRLNEDSYWSPLPRIYRHRARVAGRHDRRHARRAARQEPARQAVRARAARTRSAAAAPNGDFDAGFDVKYGVTSGLDVGLHGQHRLLAGGGRRAAGQPVALQPVLSREARLLPRELRHLPVRRWRRAAVAAGGGGGGGGRRRTAERVAGHAAVLQPPDRPVGCRRRDSDPRRHAPDRPRWARIRSAR